MNYAKLKCVSYYDAKEQARKLIEKGCIDLKIYPYDYNDALFTYTVEYCTEFHRKEYP